MKDFFGTDFLLKGRTAQRLFSEYAADMPIFDYHNHLDAREIHECRRFSNITQIWLEADHYKWRAMRALGIDEKFITGDADDYSKFEKWAYTIERLPGNPLYHWTHLELQRYFGITEPLCTSSARRIWDSCNTALMLEGFDASGLLSRMNVKALCTTDEPSDSLEWHLKIRDTADSVIQVLPSFRPDRLLHIESADFPAAIRLLEQRYSASIKNLDDLKRVISRALDCFQTAGCLVSDHGFSCFVYGRGGTATTAFRKAMDGRCLEHTEIADFKGDLLRFLGSEYNRRGMAMQLHLGAVRSSNTQMLQLLGPNSGYDSVGPTTDPFMLSAFLDDLAKKDSLPPTVLYCLNANDNTVLSTMALSFASAGVPGKVQPGSAWWFEDHVRGISRQIDELFETGLISVSVGMLTDSRSFTSFVRHEYYRRILCTRLGALVDAGEYPEDYEKLGEMIKDICYRNAVRFFGLTEKDGNL